MVYWFHTFMEGTDTDIVTRLDQLEELVEANHTLAKETNRIVRDLRRTGRIAFWFRVILWIAVLGLPILFLGPIIRYVNAATGISIPTSTNLFGVPSADEIQKAVTQYRTKVAPAP